MTLETLNIIINEYTEALFSTDHSISVSVINDRQKLSRWGSLTFDLVISSEAREMMLLILG